MVTANRDKAAALKFLKRIMKKYGRPRTVVTDGLCSYPAAMKEIGNADRQEVGRRLNNRAENALRTPDARITWEALQTRSLAGSNLVKPAHDALRLSTVSQGAPV